MIQYKTKFEGIRIFEWSFLGHGFNSGGLCLPGIGIFIGAGTYDKDPFLVKHEFGHILQYRMIGFVQFYIKIGLRSLWSAKTNGYGNGHQNYWTELWANALSMEYFNTTEWPRYRFPTKDISKNKLSDLQSWLRWIKTAD